MNTPFIPTSIAIPAQMLWLLYDSTVPIPWNVKTITIVGIDAADLSRGQVSWVSPVSRALMKAQEGDIVEVRAPSGVEQIEVLEIRYSGARGETE
jgi:hypothetical protein